MSWSKFYKDRVNSSYQLYFEKRYASFIDAIQAMEPKGILDAGCGIGSISKTFKKYGMRCTGFDISMRVVSLARQNVPDGDFFVDDILKVTSDTCTVTHGVLEHFNDKDINKILRSFPESIHYVPLDKYITPSFGDERLMSYKWWMNHHNIKDVVVFNDGYDLMFKSNY